MTITDQQYSRWLREDDARRCVLLDVATDPPRRLSVLPYTSLPTDPAPNVRYDAVIRSGVGYREELSLDRQASASGNRIELHNEDGSLDAWLDDVWHQRELVVRYGDARWSIDDYRIVATGVVDRVQQSQRAMSILLVDKLSRLNASVTDVLLGGTGQDAERLMPSVFGEVFNIRPVLYNPSTHYYRVHGSTIFVVIEVRDNGVPVDFAPEPGGFRLLQSPKGEITCSVQGDMTGGTYRNTVAALVRLLATQYGPAATRFDVGDLDTANLDAFELAHPQAVGMYLPDRATVQSCITELAASLGAHVVMSRTGKLRILKVALPAPGVPTIIRPHDYELGTLEVVGQTLPRAGVRLGYSRNWSPTRQTAQIVYPEHHTWFADEWMTTVASAPEVADEWLVDQEEEQEPTLLLDTAEAHAEAVRRLALWSVPRTVLRVRGFAQALQYELGQPVTLYGDRFGLQSGRTGQIIGLHADWTAGRCDVEVLV